MGNWKAVPRKRRKHPAIDKSAQIYSDAMHANDFKSAAAIALWTALEVGGVEGIMNAMEDANSYIRRRSRRNGLL